MPEKSTLPFLRGCWANEESRDLIIRTWFGVYELVLHMTVEFTYVTLTTEGQLLIIYSRSPLAYRRQCEHQLEYL